MGAVRSNRATDQKVRGLRPTANPVSVVTKVHGLVTAHAAPVHKVHLTR